MTIQKNLSTTNEEMQEACVLPRVIFIRAPVSGMLYHFLPFAVLKENPIEGIQRYIKKHKVDTQNSSMMRSIWNTAFHALSSDAIYFVCAMNSIPEATPQMLKAAGMTFVIGSCGPHHKRWLTTRPVERNGELVAWCVEIDMHASQFERVITLSATNMIRLVPELIERKVA